MHSKKIIIRTIIVYTLIMLLGVYITNSIISDKGNNVGKLISQLIASGYIIYIVKSIYGWDRVGFSKINLKSLIWFMPYILLLIPMIYRFMQGIYINIELFSKEVWIEIIIIFIGTSAAAFSEEVIFRGN